MQKAGFLITRLIWVNVESEDSHQTGKMCRLISAGCTAQTVDFVKQRELGAPIAQLGEHQTLDGKVAGLILTQGAVLCP